MKKMITSWRVKVTYMEEITGALCTLTRYFDEDEQAARTYAKPQILKEENLYVTIESTEMYHREPENLRAV